MDQGEDETEGQDELLRALGAEYSPAILAAAAEPVSAQELSDRLGIPLATCYRRIDALTEVGLLEFEEQVRSDHGGLTNVYRRRVDELRVEFDRDGLSVETVERRSVKTKLDEVWRTSSRE